MRRTPPLALSLVACSALALAAGCGTEADDHAHADGAHDHAHDHVQAQPSAPQERQPKTLDPRTEFPGLSVSDIAPNATLVQRGERDVNLSTIYSNGPTVLIFIQGSWRKEDRAFLSAVQTELDAIRSAGGQVFAISPEPIEALQEMSEELGLQFYVLSDAQDEAMRAFHVAYDASQELNGEEFDLGGVEPSQVNASGSTLLPGPSLFIIGREGLVRFAYCNWKPADRPLASEIPGFVQVHR